MGQGGAPGAPDLVGCPLPAEPPGGVVLEPPVLVGGVYTLRCHIIHVFPVNSLVVTLRLGGRLISHDSLECFEGQNMANVTVTHQWPARPRDLWQPLTCHWSLHLPGRVVHSSSAPVTLAVIGEVPLQGGGWGCGRMGWDPPLSHTKV